MSLCPSLHELCSTGRLGPSRIHKKGITEEVAKKRSRKNVKIQVCSEALQSSNIPRGDVSRRYPWNISKRGADASTRLPTDVGSFSTPANNVITLAWCHWCRSRLNPRQTNRQTRGPCCRPPSCDHQGQIREARERGEQVETGDGWSRKSAKGVQAEHEGWGR